MRCQVHEDERYPTLYVDDGSWMEPSTRAYLIGEGEFDTEVPDDLVKRLEAAHAELRSVENAIRMVIAVPCG